MYVYTILVVCMCALPVSIHGDSEENTNPTNITDTVVPKKYKMSKSKLLKEVYTTIEANIYENTRKLKLENFSWGIFSGTRGRLHGFQNFDLVNNNTMPVVQNHGLNVSFEFVVPTLQAVWEKSVCLGYTCAMNIQLQNAVFVLRMLFDADECVIDHLAYLKKYDKARCQANYDKSSPMSVSVIETTVRLLSQVLNTKPFEKIVKDNVNHALLQLPLFHPSDIQRLCESFREM